MNRYLFAFWMFLTMSALCIASLIWIAGDTFQVVALSFLFTCLFGSAWYNLGRYYNQQATQDSRKGNAPIVNTYNVYILSSSDILAEEEFFDN